MPLLTQRALTRSLCGNTRSLRRVRVVTRAGHRHAVHQHVITARGGRVARHSQPAHHERNDGQHPTPQPGTQKVREVKHGRHTRRRGGNSVARTARNVESPPHEYDRRTECRKRNLLANFSKSGKIDWSGWGIRQPTTGGKAMLRNTLRPIIRDVPSCMSPTQGPNP
jgi:hypothetical protein